MASVPRAALRTLPGTIAVVVAVWAAGCSWGLSAGGACTDDDECAAGNRCVNKTCSVFTGPGDGVVGDDAGPDVDGGPGAEDAGSTDGDGGALDEDGGALGDAGAPGDAGPAGDGGPPGDAGAPVDAGFAPPDAGFAPPDAGFAPTDAGPLLPIISFTTDDDTVTFPNDAVLHWSATNADSCTLLGMMRGTTGTLAIEDPCTARYDITCTGPWGQASTYVDVYVGCGGIVFGRDESVVVSSQADALAIKSSMDDALFSTRRCLEISGDLTIEGSSDLTSLDALYGVSRVGGQLKIDGNSSLSSLRGLCLLRDIGTDLQVSSNPALTSLRVFDRLADYPTGADDDPGISIHDNNALTSLFRFNAWPWSSFCVEVYSNASLSGGEFAAFDQTVGFAATTVDQPACP